MNAVAPMALASVPRVADDAEAALVGASGGLSGLCGLLRRAARSDANVLVIGETGTGKELVARHLHDLGRRARGPFVPLNCAALPEGLIESELFGYDQGAFTGATKVRKGRFELAHGGTLFLDEIGDVSPRVQIALLRVLQERTIERVGGTPVPVDVRVIAASHRDLPGLIREGKFREDLFYRLNVVALQVPPLRQRAQDIPDLVGHFVHKYARPGERKEIGSGVLEAMARHPWPGNVRELENMVQRAVIMATGRVLEVSDFVFACPPPSRPLVREEVQDTEANRLRRLLLENGGNCARTARELGIPRTTLVSRAKKLGLI